VHAVSPDLIPEVLRSASDGRGADDIVVAVGHRGVQIEAQGWLAPGGVLNLFGGLKRGEHVIDLDTLRVHYDEIRVVGSSGGSPADMAEALRMTAAGEFDPGNHLSLVGSLDQFPRALEMIRKTETEGKIVLYPHIAPTPLTPTVRWGRVEEEQFLRGRSL
jgi:L-iditol 2-dehydrogenase